MLKLLGSYISDEANAAAAIKRDKPIMVVLGKPPYSGHSSNKGEWIARLVRDYYFVDGQPLGERNPKWLQDDYVKFIRFGQWRIDRTGAGVLAFITNHGYLDNPTFRGMRQSLMNTFTDIYVLDLHGNAKKRESSPEGGPDENVFDIQQGVAIGIFVKEPGKKTPGKVHHADLWGDRKGKYEWLMEQDVSTTEWEDVQSEPPYYLFQAQNDRVWAEYEGGWKITDIMTVNSIGVVTSRDSLVISFDRATAEAHLKMLQSNKPDTEIKQTLLVNERGAWKLPEARAKVRGVAVQDILTTCTYKPFDFRPFLYHPALLERARIEVARHIVRGKSPAFIFTRSTSPVVPFTHTIVTPFVPIGRTIPDLASITYMAPIYLFLDSYDHRSPQVQMSGLSPWSEANDGRWPNLSPEFVADLESRFGLRFVSNGKGDLQSAFGPEDAFDYIYAVLHSPAYRERYAEFLKRDFPRIPLTSNPDLFRALAENGTELVALHLLKSPVLSKPITSYPVPGDNLVERGHPRYLPPGDKDPATGQPLEEGRVYISKDDPKSGKKGQFFKGVPPEVWEFQVGGYQVCDKWLKDRRGRALGHADIEHYEKIIVALKETIRLMEEIDDAIEEHGGWPIQ